MSTNLSDEVRAPSSGQKYGLKGQRRGSSKKLASPLENRIIKPHSRKNIKSH